MQNIIILMYRDKNQIFVWQVNCWALKHFSVYLFIFFFFIHINLRCMGTPPCSCAILQHIKIISNLPVSFPRNIALPKWGLLLNQRICSCRSKFFGLVVDQQEQLLWFKNWPHWEKSQKWKHQRHSHGSVPIYLKNKSGTEGFGDVSHTACKLFR